MRSPRDPSIPPGNFPGWPRTASRVAAGEGLRGWEAALESRNEAYLVD